MGWFNYYGLVIMAIIMIPNIIFAITHKDGFKNTYTNKAVVILEQTGRYACFALMVFNIPYACLGFWFNGALTVYLSVNGALCVAYSIFWIICWNKNGKLKALSLSIIPSVIFLFSGIILAYIPLIAFAVLFGANHILLSYKNIPDKSEYIKFKYIKLNDKNFSVNSLDNFKRYQKVTHCWRKVGDEYLLMPVEYTENWSMTELRELAQRILKDISNGSKAYAAVFKGEIIGFALIDHSPFGSNNQYIDLAELYVSAPHRGKGVGRKLFELACAAAKEFGATKMYISAHSAEESAAAYKSYGCVFAQEINRELAEKEPYDLQLEFELK